MTSTTNACDSLKNLKEGANRNSCPRLFLFQVQHAEYIQKAYKQPALVRNAIPTLYSYWLTIESMMTDAQRADPLPKLAQLSLLQGEIETIGSRGTITTSLQHALEDQSTTTVAKEGGAALKLPGISLAQGKDETSPIAEQLKRFPDLTTE